MKPEKLNNQQLAQKVAHLEARLARTQWLHEKENITETKPYIPFYGDVTALNTERTILDNVGSEMLKSITSDLMDLLDTSITIYEKNGDYAFGEFNSGWCQLLDASSRKLCNTRDNKTALNCGKWLCHDDCWNNSAKAAIRAKKSTDIDCIGGIKLFAEPIFTDDEVIGSINIGYGNPPTDDKTLMELSEKFSIDFETLKEKALAYNPRPEFIIEISKKRLKSTAKLIGEIVSRKKAEKALKQSEERFQAFMNHVPGATFIKNKKGQLLYCNEQFAKMLNTSSDKILGTNIDENISPELQKLYELENKEVIEMGRILKSESVFPHDGENSHWFTYKFPVEIETEKLIGAISLDITEQKNTEQELQNKQLLLRTIIDNIPDAIFAKNANYLKTLSNLADLHNLGAKSESDVLGKNDFEFFPKEIAEEFYADDKYVIEKGIPIINKEEILSDKNGKKNWRLVSKIPLRNTNEQIIGLAGISRDITREKHAKQALKESEEKYKALYKSMNEGVCLHELIYNESGVPVDYKIIDANPKYEEILKIQKKQVINKMASTVYPGNEPPYLKEYAEVALSGKSITFETYHKSLDKHFHISVFSPKKGKFATIFQDISDSVHIQNELKEQANKLKKLNNEKDQYISILAHDLKSPFNSILGFLDLLTRNIRKYNIDKIEKQLNMIYKSAKSTSDLLNDILLWGRASSDSIPFEPKELNFTAICNNVVESLKLAANTKKIKINLFADEKINLFADESMLNTVLRNLVSNAIKFTHKNGKIDIYAEKNENDVLITISDNGIGIEPNRIDKIFDIQHLVSTEGTSNEKGTGLGLLLCKEFVDKHGGKIWAESETNKGSTFFFTIPQNL